MAALESSQEVDGGRPADEGRKEKAAEDRRLIHNPRSLGIARFRSPHFFLDLTGFLPDGQKQLRTESAALHYNIEDAEVNEATFKEGARHVEVVRG